MSIAAQVHSTWKRISAAGQNCGSGYAPQHAVARRLRSGGSGVKGGFLARSSAKAARETEAAFLLSGLGVRPRKATGAVNAGPLARWFNSTRAHHYVCNETSTHE